MSIPRPATELPNPKVHSLPIGKKLVRFYNPHRQNWDTGRYYGPIRDQRFDHHTPPKGHSDTESVWYASGSLVGAVAESFGRTGIFDRNCGRRICIIKLSAPFDVVDFYGVGPRYLGLDQQICTTTDYKATQEWARAIYLQFPKLVGIRWRGRHASSENVILTDRVNLTTLVPLSDHEISETAVWPRIANAARKCKIKIV